MLSQNSQVVFTPEEFLDALLKEDRKNRDMALVEKAAHYAFDAHKEQKRSSGEPYISHPFAVALIVDQLQLDTASICGALLHDVLEDCETTEEQLTEEFGETICNLVDGVTKLSKIQFSSKAELQAESLRKMLLAMTRDIRVILIKLCDRLHNMRTLQHLPEAKQKRIANETLEIFCPLAHRLGIYNLKWQLEDLCFKYANPKAYYDILRMIAQKRKEREAFIQSVIKELQDYFEEEKLPAKISGRPKSFYSIFQKIQKNQKYIDEMYDLIGIRVITDTEAHCYAILGMVHSIWTPLQQRFKDYIAVPKPNLYQSLHTTVIHPEGQMLEVQIRTYDMHQTAEIGIAAHFHYKEKRSNHNGRQKKPNELNWLKQIVRWHSDIRDSQEFIENIRLDLFQNMVYAFTPNGEVIELREGSTPIDFAYYIHTEIGHKCVGAKVDDRVVPLSYQLKNGDIVKIITSNQSKGPNRDWLEVVKTRRAREAILSTLRKASKEDYIAKGAKMIQTALEEKIKRLPQDKKVSYREIINSQEFHEVIEAYGYRDISYIQEAVGKGDINFQNIMAHLSIFKVEEEPEEALQKMAQKSSLKRRKGSNTILVEDCPGMLIRMSKCCSPVYGDDIVGFITRGRGVTVHRRNCPNAINLVKNEAERQVDVSWDPRSLLSKETSFQTQLQIDTKNKPNVILQITSVVAKFKINIHSLNAKSKKDGGTLSFTVEVSNIAQLNNLIKAISDLEDVVSVYRVEPTKKASGRKKK
jgi:GTP pyrophosphokinase